MTQLTKDVGRAQAFSAQVQGERDTLMQRVLDLEQERIIFRRHLASIPELHRARQDTMAVRRRQQRMARRLKSLTDRWQTTAGNRGYVVQAGRLTAGRSTMWIRVHDPQPAEPAHRP